MRRKTAHSGWIGGAAVAVMPRESADHEAAREAGGRQTEQCKLVLLEGVGEQPGKLDGARGELAPAWHLLASQLGLRAFQDNWMLRVAVATAAEPLSALPAA